MTETKKTFNQKLMEAMKEMDNPKKEKLATVQTKSGKEYSYNYETLDQVLGVVRPALMNHGLMLVQGVKWNDSINEFVLETGIMDESEERILDVRPFRRCDDAQVEGSWETYMRRYAIRTAFGLTGEDDDGAATLGKNQNHASNGATGGFKAMQGAATEKQLSMVYGKLKQLAELRGVANDEAKSALADKVGVDDLDNMTKAQASEAITMLVAWIGKAQDQVAEMADEDIDF